MGIFGLFKRKTKEITEQKTNGELDLECELIIYNEKKSNGRISTNTMKQLREIYGTRRADRAMWRQQKEKHGNADTNPIVELLSNVLQGYAKKNINSSSDNTN